MSEGLREESSWIAVALMFAPVSAVDMTIDSLMKRRLPIPVESFGVRFDFICSAVPIEPRRHGTEEKLAAFLVWSPPILESAYEGARGFRVEVLCQPPALPVNSSPR